MHMEAMQSVGVASDCGLAPGGLRGYASDSPSQVGGVLKRWPLKAIPVVRAARMIARGTWSFCIDRPLVVSFELTHSCTSDCRHCDKGGIKPEPEGLLRAEDYRRLRSALNPMAVQLSGGEPLLRKDLEEIVRAVKEPSGLPYTILVTNGRLFTEEKYLALRALGVNQFSISLDFPDARHD